MHASLTPLSSQKKPPHKQVHMRARIHLNNCARRRTRYRWQVGKIKADRMRVTSCEGCRGARHAALQTLKCHPDKANNQLENSARNKHTHSSCGCRRKTPGRCIIHTRATNRLSSSGRVSLRASAQHALLGHPGRVTSQIVVWNKKKHKFKTYSALAISFSSELSSVSAHLTAKADSRLLFHKDTLRAACTVLQFVKSESLKLKLLFFF